MSEQPQNDQPTPTRRVLRMNNLRADGSPNTETVELVVRDPFSGVELRNDDGTPAVAVTLRPMSDDERKAIIETHTSWKKDPVSGRLMEVTNEQAVADDAMKRVILDWRGLVAADDQPLCCTDATKVLIDKHLKMQIQRKLFSAEAVEVSAESFR